MFILLLLTLTVAFVGVAIYNGISKKQSNKSPIESIVGTVTNSAKRGIVGIADSMRTPELIKKEILDKYNRIEETLNKKVLEFYKISISNIARLENIIELNKDFIKQYKEEGKEIYAEHIGVLNCMNQGLGSYNPYPSKKEKMSYSTKLEQNHDRNIPKGKFPRALFKKFTGSRISMTRNPKINYYWSGSPHANYVYNVMSSFAGKPVNKLINHICSISKNNNGWRHRQNLWNELEWIKLGRDSEFYIKSGIIVKRKKRKKTNKKISPILTPEMLEWNIVEINRIYSILKKCSLQEIMDLRENTIGNLYLNYSGKAIKSGVFISSNDYMYMSCLKVSWYIVIKSERLIDNTSQIILPTTSFTKPFYLYADAEHVRKKYQKLIKREI